MKSRTGFVITIDGPAGSGKSTASSILAKKLGFSFLTTGSFYRGLAVLCARKKTDVNDPLQVASAATKGLEIKADQNGTRVYIDNQEVTHSELRSEATATLASKVSAYPQVRTALLEPQRSFQRPPGLIAEGRDCGTVVFPNADVKIYLTASLDTRAGRRSAETNAENKSVLQDIAKRDSADKNRKVAPMAKASDALEIDTSTMSIDEVVNQILRLVEAKKKTDH